MGKEYIYSVTEHKKAEKTNILTRSVAVSLASSYQQAEKQTKQIVNKQKAPTGKVSYKKA